jgi:hypothetical protein
MAVAPGPVFTGRTYGDTSQLYGPGLVRRSAHYDLQTRISASRTRSGSPGVSQVRAFVAQNLGIEKVRSR